MSKLWLISCAALSVAGAGFGLDAGAQSYQELTEPVACVANRAAQPDPVLAAKVAAADQSIGQGKPGAWSALADLGQYACVATGDRQPADAAFRRCISRCVDERDVYFARIFYANVLERFGDLLGAENQYLQALQSSRDAQRGYTAYMDTRAEEAAAKGRSDADLARTRSDAPPLSAIPVESNSLAQLAFGRTIEVVGNAWIEPADGSSRGSGVLNYRRASMPDPRTFARTVAFASGQRFVVVADLGAAGCRIAVGDARYDVEECPWRSGRADAGLFRVVDERTPLEPALRIRVRSPVSGELVESPRGGRPAAQ